MIGIVLVTHGSIGTALIEGAQHVLNQTPHVEALAVAATDDLHQCSARLTALIHQVDQGDGVLVFSDLMGGSPSNIARKLVPQMNIRVVAGVNLPMLLAAICNRFEPIDAVVDKALKANNRHCCQLHPPSICET